MCCWSLRYYSPLVLTSVENYAVLLCNLNTIYTSYIYLYIGRCNFCLYVCKSHHHGKTAGPICPKSQRFFLYFLFWFERALFDSLPGEVFSNFLFIFQKSLAELIIYVYNYICLIITVRRTQIHLGPEMSFVRIFYYFFRIFLIKIKIIGADLGWNGFLKCFFFLLFFYWKGLGMGLSDEGRGC